MPRALSPSPRRNAPPYDKTPVPETAAAIPGMMSIRGFESALARCLELLDGVHTGLTLFAVGWRGSSPPPPPAEQAVVSALSPLGSVGRLSDGRIGMVYLGPGGGDGVGTETLRGYVLNRLAGRLTEQGWGACAALLDLSAAHGWTDQGATAARMIAALPKSGGLALPKSAAAPAHAARGRTTVT